MKLFGRRLAVVQVDGADLGAVRSIGGVGDENLHRLGGAGDQRLHRAVGAVAHPAIQLLLLRRHHQEIAKADALDKAMHMHPQGGNIVAQTPSPAA